MNPLNYLLQRVAPKSSSLRFRWNTEVETTFNNTKTALTNTVTFEFPSESEVYGLYTDANAKGLGAFLTATNPNTNKTIIIGFHIATFNKAEKQRTIF